MTASRSRSLFASDGFVGTWGDVYAFILLLSWLGVSTEKGIGYLGWGGKPVASLIVNDILFNFGVSIKWWDKGVSDSKMVTGPCNSVGVTGVEELMDSKLVTANKELKVFLQFKH